VLPARLAHSAILPIRRNSRLASTLTVVRGTDVRIFVINAVPTSTGIRMTVSQKLDLRPFLRPASLPSLTRKYFSTNFPARLLSGAPQLRQVRCLSRLLGGACTRTSLYSAWQVEHSNLVVTRSMTEP
jgi:hypothetical protein